MKTRSLRRKRLFGNLLTYCIVAAAFVILQLLNAGGMLSPSLQGQLVPICAYVTMAVALNLVVGISGELSLGHAGFMSIGAFAGSALALALQSTVTLSPLRLALAMVFGAVIAAALGFLIGQSIGRWGNFMNREAHGAVTDCFLKMGLVEANGEVVYYHPTFLYESFWNLIGFIGLHFFSKKRKFDGEVFLFYLAWYGLGRMWVEGLRTDSLYLFGTGIRVSQLLAVLCFLAAGILLLVMLLKVKPGPEKLYVNQVAASKADAADSNAPEQTEKTQTEQNMGDEQDGSNDH